MSSAAFLEESMPSETMLPDCISKLPERIISIPFNATAYAVKKKVAEMGEKGNVHVQELRRG